MGTGLFAILAFSAVSISICETIVLFVLFKRNQRFLRIILNDKERILYETKKVEPQKQHHSIARKQVERMNLKDGSE